MVLLFGGLVAANVAAWAWAFAAFGDRPAVMATALLAWVFGLRHAVDADHIAAIDNVVRKLMQAGDAPRSGRASISRSAIPPWSWSRPCCSRSAWSASAATVF